MKPLTEQWNEVTEELFQEALRHTGDKDKAWRATLSTIEKIVFNTPQNNKADFSSLIADEPRDNIGTLREIKKD